MKATALRVGLALSWAWAVVGQPATAEPGAAGFAPEGTWHLLVHYQDEAAADPDLWRWDDRVWDFQGEGDERVFTQFEMVRFVDGRGRFARDPSGTRRAPAWEPDAGQLREIERGLFVNPRGARTLRLSRTPEGWRSGQDLEGGVRAGRSMAMALAAHITPSAIELRRVLLVHEQARQDIAAERFEIEAAEPGLVHGRYTARGREGWFSLRETRLRERVRPDVARSEGALTLKPDQIGDWGNFLPSLLRPLHYFPERRVQVSTSPPGADLDLLYLREGGSMRLFEQARSPVVVKLPSRFVASEGDVLLIRAFAPGYRRAEAHVSVHGGDEVAELALEPSARVVQEVWARDFGRGASVTVLADGPIDIERHGEGGVLRVVLPDTALGEGVAATLPGTSGSTLTAVRPFQLGSELMLSLELAPGTRAEDARFQAAALASRRQWKLLVSLPAASGASPPTLPAWFATEPPAPTPCDLAFDAALREGLDRDRLRRALAPGDPATAPILSEAIERLARARPTGEVALLGGARLDPGTHAGRTASHTYAHEIVGLLAVFEGLLGGGEAGDAVLASLLAPGTRPSAFLTVLEGARSQRAACRQK